MARCTATPPCNYKLNGEVHDHGCPARPCPTIRALDGTGGQS